MKKGLSAVMSVIILAAFIIAIEGIWFTYFVGQTKESDCLTNWEIDYFRECAYNSEGEEMCVCEDCLDVICYDEGEETQFVCHYELYESKKGCPYEFKVVKDITEEECEEMLDDAWKKVSYDNCDSKIRTGYGYNTCIIVVGNEGV